MKHILTLSLCFLALSLSAQETITYPYNPDGDVDGAIASPDLLDLLGVYGGEFSPSEILVGDSTLSFWVDQLSATVLTQQATIDSLVELQPKEYIITVADGLDGDWVTIASVGDDSTSPFKLRADADFEFTHNVGGSHQKIKVRASHLFGYGHTLDLHRISYSNSQAMIVAFRIAHGNTYDGAVLQMKVRQNDFPGSYNSIKLRVTNNNNDSGWHIHPDILQGQSLSADNSPIGYVDHPSASDAPYIEFYPSIDGEDCLGYYTAEGDVILNSNLVVNGMNITEIISSLQNNIDLLTTQLEQDQQAQDQQAFSIENTNSGDVDLYNDGLVRIWLDDSTTDDIELEIFNVLPFPPGSSYHVSWTTSSLGFDDHFVVDLNASGISSTSTLDFNFTTDEIMTLRIWSPVAGTNFPYYEATLIKSSSLYSGAPLLTSVTKSTI